MICPRCHSSNVNTQVLNDVRIVDQHHGCIWWLVIGIWWIPIKWIVFTIPALIFKIFGGKKQKIISSQNTICVCQQCGYSWQI